VRLLDVVAGFGETQGGAIGEGYPVEPEVASYPTVQAEQADSSLVDAPALQALASRLLPERGPNAAPFRKRDAPIGPRSLAAMLPRKLNSFRNGRHLPSGTTDCQF
jgi:hypothetical protein